MPAWNRFGNLRGPAGPARLLGVGLTAESLPADARQGDSFFDPMTRKLYVYVDDVDEVVVPPLLQPLGGQDYIYCVPVEDVIIKPPYTKLYRGYLTSGAAGTRAVREGDPVFTSALPVLQEDENGDALVNGRTYYFNYERRSIAGVDVMHSPYATPQEPTGIPPTEWDVSLERTPLGVRITRRAGGDYASAHFYVWNNEDSTTSGAGMIHSFPREIAIPPELSGQLTLAALNPGGLVTAQLSFTAA